MATSNLQKHVDAEPERSVRQLILDSVGRPYRVGVGLQGEVYRFAVNDPFFDQFLIKRIRLLCDVPGQNETSFRRICSRAAQLLPLNSPLNGHNYGQPLMIDDTRNFFILLRQRGKPLSLVIEQDLPMRYGNPAMRPEERYHLYLNWLLHEVSDATLTDLARKIRRVKTANMAVDHVKKDNIFWDEKHQQFELIDLFERFNFLDVFDKAKRYNAVQRPVQIAYATLQGVADPKLATKDELFELLTYDIGHRLQAHGFTRTGTEKSISRDLEDELRQRIAALPEPLVEVHAEARPYEVAGIANMGVADVADLKACLRDILAHYLGK